jgi:hypothetical protein
LTRPGHDERRITIFTAVTPPGEYPGKPVNGKDDLVELEGRPFVEVPIFRHKGFPFTFWVLAPVPVDVLPVAFSSFGADGRRLARSTEFAGYPGGCR